MRERVAPAVTDVAGRADKAVSAAREQVEALSGQVEERPLPAILIGIRDRLPTWAFSEPISSPILHLPA